MESTAFAYVTWKAFLPGMGACSNNGTELRLPNSVTIGKRLVQNRTVPFCLLRGSSFVNIGSHLYRGDFMERGYGNRPSVSRRDETVRAQHSV